MSFATLRSIASLLNTAVAKHMGETSMVLKSCRVQPHDVVFIPAGWLVLQSTVVVRVPKPDTSSKLRVPPATVGAFLVSVFGAWLGWRSNAKEDPWCR